LKSKGLPDGSGPAARADIGQLHRISSELLENVLFFCDAPALGRLEASCTAFSPPPPPPLSLVQRIVKSKAKADFDADLGPRPTPQALCRYEDYRRLAANNPIDYADAHAVLAGGDLTDLALQTEGDDAWSAMFRLTEMVRASNAKSSDVNLSDNSCLAAVAAVAAVAENNAAVCAQLVDVGAVAPLLAMLRSCGGSPECSGVGKNFAAEALLRVAEAS